MRYEKVIARVREVLAEATLPNVNITIGMFESFSGEKKIGRGVFFTPSPELKLWGDATVGVIEDEEGFLHVFGTDPIPEEMGHLISEEDRTALSAVYYIITGYSL